MVGAPVSGAQWGAQAAALVFMVGAAAADLARVRPLLDAMGRAVFHLGATGAGHTMKCIHNTITAAMPAGASMSDFVRWIEQPTGTPIASAAAPAPQRRRRA